MALYAELIGLGNTVVEVGGHIGFVSLYYSKLVGNDGFVYVFEPGENNLKYIRENIKEEKNISLIEKAANDYTGTVDFYIENLTGQNNSILKDFSVLEKNIASQRASNIKRTKKIVKCISLDDFVKDIDTTPEFIKIDVEGAELNVLQGMKEILKDNLILMVEVTENKEEVYNLLSSYNYMLFTPNKRKIESYNELSSDTFAIKKTHKLFEKVFNN